MPTQYENKIQNEVVELIRTYGWEGVLSALASYTRGEEQAAVKNITEKKLDTEQIEIFIYERIRFQNMANLLENVVNTYMNVRK